MAKKQAFEYAPAPESRSIVDIKPSYGLFVDGEFVDGHGTSFKTISPATEEVLAEVAEADEADVDRAVKAARRAYTRVWSEMPGSERAKYLYRIARIIQERGRELAVLESLDNGKPIKEIPRRRRPDRRRALLLLRRLGRQAAYLLRLRHRRPLGVAGQVIPWNFPLLMLAWKIAPALACGNTVVLKPAETTPLTALLLRRDLPAGRPAARRGQHRHRRRRHRRRRSSRTRTSTRSPSPARPTSARRSPAPSPARTRRSPSSSAARPPTSSSTTRRSTRPSRASSTASSSTRATSAAPARGCWCRSRSPTSVLARLKRRMATLRVGDPLDKNTDIGAINSAEQLAKIRELSDIGEAEGAERWSPPCELPDHGFWFPPTVFTGVSQAHRIAREEIFGPVLSVLTFRTPAEAVEKANNTPYGLSAGVWTDKGSRILKMAERAARRRGVGQHVQQVRPDQPVRRLQGVRLRPRGRPARASPRT